MNWPGLRDSVVTAAAGAALIGGGSTIISNKSAIAVLTERVARLEALDGKIDALSTQLEQTREELIRSQTHPGPR